MSAPKIIHIVWFGSELYVPYELNILTFILKNPTFLVRIYRDQNIELTRLKFRAYPNVAVIDYQNIYKDLAKSSAPNDSSLNLRFLIAEATDPNGNLAAASDIFRIDLLMYYGGYYVDTDIQCRSPIKEEDLPHGFKTNIGKFMYNRFFSAADAQVINDFMIAVPLSPIVQKIRETIHQNYLKVGDLQLFLKGRASLIKDFESMYREDIIFRSGPGAIDAGIKEFEKEHGGIYSQNILLYYIPYLRHRCENSWMPTGAANLREQHERMQTAATYLQKSAKSMWIRKK